MKNTEKINVGRLNKKRNVGLLYEFLIRHISKCIIDDNKDEANKALIISKKYFSEGCPLKNELKLFEAVLSFNSKYTFESINKIVEYSCKNASLMNSRILDEQKSKLIKDINYNLSKNVYEYRVPQYINYSSLQLLFNDSRNKTKKLSEVDRIKIKDLLVQRIVKENLVKPEIKVNPTYSNTVYKILVEKFNKKYSDKLSESQKKLVGQYTSFLISENVENFKGFLIQENKRILNSLSNIKDKKILEDKELFGKISQCKDRYKSINNSSIDEKFILELLEYQRLVDEIEQKE